MSEVFSTLGKVFTNKAFAPALSAGTVGLGELGNLLAGRQQQQAYRAAQDQERYISSLTPEALTAMAARGAAPLDNALVQSVNNSVQGDLAQRGLAQAPGLFAASESQALAPFAQENLQSSLQALMQKLGLPLEYLNAMRSLLPGQQSMSPAIMQMLQQFAKLKGGGASPSVGGSGPIFGFPNTTPPTFPTPGAPIPSGLSDLPPLDTSALVGA